MPTQTKLPQKRAFSGLVGMAPDNDAPATPAPEVAAPVEAPARRGRPRKYANDAEKQDAYRQRKEDTERLTAAVLTICTNIAMANYLNHTALTEEEGLTILNIVEESYPEYAATISSFREQFQREELREIKKSLAYIAESVNREATSGLNILDAPQGKGMLVYVADVSRNTNIGPDELDGTFRGPGGTQKSVQNFNGRETDDGDLTGNARRSRLVTRNREEDRMIGYVEESMTDAPVTEPFQEDYVIRFQLRTLGMLVPGTAYEETLRRAIPWLALRGLTTSEALLLPPEDKETLLADWRNYVTTA
jgi:hypothetical protein